LIVDPLYFDEILDRLGTHKFEEGECACLVYVLRLDYVAVLNVSILIEEPLDVVHGGSDRDPFDFDGKFVDFLPILKLLSVLSF
jgi:hypothetical protein